MHIKLTRTNGNPFYVNPLFIMRIEYRQLGGSVLTMYGETIEVQEPPESINTKTKEAFRFVLTSFA